MPLLIPFSALTGVPSECMPSQWMIFVPFMIALDKLILSPSSNTTSIWYVPTFSVDSKEKYPPFETEDLFSDSPVNLKFDISGGFILSSPKKDKISWLGLLKKIL